MKLTKANEDHGKIASRLTLTTLVLGGSMATNVVLAVCVMSLREVVLVPELPAQVALSGSGRVSRDYLEAVARDCAYLFLNRTPDNQDYFDQQLLQVAEPETYQAIRTGELEARRQVIADHASQSFAPTDWFVDTGKLYVEIAGHMLTSHGADLPPVSEYKTYGLRFLRHGASLRLSSFEELTPSKIVGLKLPASPPPPARATSISGEAHS